MFWDCPSSNKWPPNLAVNKETKQLKKNPIFLCKSSWKFNKNKECDLTLKNLWITFQALDYKEKNILDLNDNDNLLTRLTYFKGGTLGLNTLDTLICCMHMLSELSQIMLQLANIISGFFPRNSSLVYVETIQSKLEIISCIAVGIIRSTEILKEIYWKISLHFLSSIQEYFPFMKASLNSNFTVILLC